MKILNISLLFFAYCVYGKSIPTDLQPSIRVSNRNPSSDHHAFADKKYFSNEQQLLNLPPKPNVVVTFVANSQAIEPNPTIEDEPLFFDVLQRLMQFVFAPFSREMERTTKIEETPNNTMTNKALDELFSSLYRKDNNSNELDASTASSKERCEHDPNGFCKNCHNARRISGRGSSAIESTNMISLPKITFSNPGFFAPYPSDVTSNDKTNHIKHYFLSISGDTAKSVTAPNTSELRHKRVKRYHAIHPLPQQKNRAHNIAHKLALDSSNIYKVAQVHTSRQQLPNQSPEPLDPFMNFSFLASLNDSSQIQNNITRNKIPSNSANYTEEEITKPSDDDRYNFDVPIQPAKQSRSFEYFITVTLPTFLACLLVILFMCACLRTRGWCCSLFLTNPKKTLQDKMEKERKPQKKKMRHRKQQAKVQKILKSRAI